MTNLRQQPELKSQHLWSAVERGTRPRPEERDEEGNVTNGNNTPNWVARAMLDDLNTLQADRDLWRGRAEGAIYALMRTHPDMLAGDITRWIADCAKAIELMREGNAVMERNIKAQGERIVELATFSVTPELAKALRVIFEYAEIAYAQQEWGMTHPKEFTLVREWLAAQKEPTDAAATE